MLFPDCDYWNEERDDEFSPYTLGDCKFCYRYKTCKEYYDKKQKEKDMEE